MENYENREFMIFNVLELSNIDFTQVYETSIDTVRKSVDQTKTFVKWDGETIPSSVDSLLTKEGPYTYTEILSILSTSEWTEEMPMIWVPYQVDQIYNRALSQQEITQNYNSLKSRFVTYLIFIINPESERYKLWQTNLKSRMVSS